jgi:DNA-binding transcriptional ArsR family regulator
LDVTPPRGYRRPVIRFVFSVEDLARMRFAISPMWEAIRSLVALQDPAGAALHLPWLRSLSGELGGVALAPVVALIPPRGYMPDFLTPPPGGPLGRIDDDLDALRRTPVKQIRHDIELFRAQHPRAPIDGAWLEHPRREVRRLADVVEAYWGRAIQPSWPRIQAFLDADIAHRARRLAQGGPAELFADLHPDVAWASGRLDAVSARTATIELAGRGPVLMPSAFQWARPATIELAPWQPTLIYPARGIATLWDAGTRAADGLVRLLGTTRAAILAALDAPRSTADVAQLLSISPAGASHHLTTLRDAGLASARREGRTVLYVRTPTGDALAAGDAQEAVAGTETRNV